MFMNFTYSKKFVVYIIYKCMGGIEDMPLYLLLSENLPLVHVGMDAHT